MICWIKSLLKCCYHSYVVKICRFSMTILFFGRTYHLKTLGKSLQLKRLEFILSCPVLESRDRARFCPVSRDKNFAVPSKGLSETLKPE